MLQWVKKVLTKDDNETFDEIKVGAFVVLVAASLSLLNASWLCVYLVMYKGQDAFDANAFLSGIGSFLTGAAAVIAGGGIGIGARNKLSQGGNGGENAR